MMLLMVIVIVRSAQRAQPMMMVLIVATVGLVRWKCEDGVMSATAAVMLVAMYSESGSHADSDGRIDQQLQ